MDATITPRLLSKLIESSAPPLVIDVRREPTYLAAEDMIRGAIRRDPASVGRWAKSLPPNARPVVYCVHGLEVGQGAAQALREAGIEAAYLEGGIEAWRESGGELAAKPSGSATAWVTRERPKVDRIACPWLLRRFVDPGARILYVPPGDVARVAEARGVTAFDVPGVAFSHEGERCSFDAFVAAFRLRDPALEELARIVRGADTARIDLAAQSAGLAAISIGLSRVFVDDHEMLASGMAIYDALYAWCREGKTEVHTWNPEAYR